MCDSPFQCQWRPAVPDHLTCWHVGPFSRRSWPGSWCAYLREKGVCTINLCPSWRCLFSNWCSPPYPALTLMDGHCDSRDESMETVARSLRPEFSSGYFWSRRHVTGMRGEEEAWGQRPPTPWESRPLAWWGWGHLTGRRQLRWRVVTLWCSHEGHAAPADPASDITASLSHGKSWQFFWMAVRGLAGSSSS